MKKLAYKATIKGESLIIEIETTEPTPSNSGKTLLVATTHGGKVIDSEYKGKEVTLSVNAYISPKPRPFRPNAEPSTVLKGKILKITLPIEEVTSNSEKTNLIASTYGPIVSNVNIDNKNVMVSVNAYVYPN